MASPPAASPDSQVAVAVVPFKSPFVPITFYEEAKTTGDAIANRRLWYNKDGKGPKDLNSKDTPLTSWSVFAPGVAAQIIPPETQGTGTSSITTANMFWATDGSMLGYWEQVAQQTVLPSTEVKVEVKTTDHATASGSSTSITSTPADKPSGTGTSKLTDPTSTNTSASSSTATSAAISTSGSRGTVQNAAAAGIGVGCFLAGMFIAGVLACLFVKRKRSANGVRDSEASTMALMHREKGPVAKTTSISSGSPIASALESGLTQPLEDKAISGEISKISNLIKNHVQSYYHGRAVSPGMIDNDDLQALGENLPVSVGSLSTLLYNPGSREIALRFCLAWVVTSRIQPNDSSNTTFLPPEVAKCMQSMSHVEHASRVQSLLYTKWRALTSELLQPTYVRSPFSAGDGRVRNIQAAAKLLDTVLRPFADSRMDDGARTRNLEEILKRSAQFAFTLFSQPTTWDFDWQNEQGVSSGSLCIFPALVQVADENGEALRPPRPFSEAVNRRLDEWGI